LPLPAGERQTGAWPDGSVEQGGDGVGLAQRDDDVTDADLLRQDHVLAGPGRRDWFSGVPGAGALFADRPKARVRSPSHRLTAQFEQKPHTVRVWFQ